MARRRRSYGRPKRERHDQIQRHRLADNAHLDFDADGLTWRVVLGADGRTEDALDARFVAQSLQDIQLDQVAGAFDVRLADELVVPRAVRGMTQGGKLTLAGLESV